MYGSSPEETLAQLTYQSHEEVPTTFIMWSNEINRISRVPTEERVIITADWASGGCGALQPEQGMLS